MGEGKERSDGFYLARNNLRRLMYIIDFNKSVARFATIFRHVGRITARASGMFVKCHIFQIAAAIMHAQKQPAAGEQIYEKNQYG